MKTNMFHRETYRSSNKNIDKHIDNKEQVKGNNIFAEYTPSYPNLYVVYSYGYHFPMYVYDEDSNMWFANSDRYPVSTSKHQSQARPSQPIDMFLNTDQLMTILRLGSYMEWTIQKAQSDNVETYRQGV